MHMLSFICGGILAYLIHINITSNDSNSDPDYPTDTELISTSSKEQSRLEALLEISEFKNKTSTSTGHNANAIPDFVKRVKVLCLVMTHPKNHQTKAIHVKRTWGRRCNKLLFISFESDSTLPTTVLKGIRETREIQWTKTRRTFQLIYDKYLNDADFFVKADDDTYIVVENLRYLLKDYNSSVPSAFGCHFGPRSNDNGLWNVTNNNCDGAGPYVLSRGGVKALIEKGYKSKMCNKKWQGGPEDIGECLQSANVNFVDTRDKYGRNRFCNLIPPNIKPEDTYLFEYFLYNLRAYGMPDLGTNEDKDNTRQILKHVD